MAEPGQKNISAFIEPAIVSLFDEMCERNGCRKRRAIEAAIRAWLVLPDEVRTQLKALTGDQLMNLEQIFESISLKQFENRIHAAVRELGLRLETRRSPLAKAGPRRSRKG